MTAMTPALLTAIKNSLPNSQHAWEVVSAVTHSTPSMPGLSLAVGGVTLNTGGVTPQTVTGGASSVTGPASDALVDKTFQLKSEPLGLVLVVMAELRNGILDHLTVYYRGSGFTTDDEDLYDTIVAMADPELVTQQTEFETMIRKKFVTAVRSATASLTCTGTKV
jgi:hypothetical protein